MKKKAYLLICVCLILIVELFGINVLAAELSGTAMRGLFNQNSGEVHPGETAEEIQTEKDGEEAVQPEEDEEIQPEKGNEETEPKEKPYETRLSLGLLLYKGDTTSVGIRYFNKDVYQAVSSNPSVVRVSKKGRIKALKCGKADVTVVLENDGCRDKLVLRVRVKASSFAKTSSHGEGAVKMKRASQAGLAAYRELAPGKKISLKASAKSAGTEISYIICPG